MVRCPFDVSVGRTLCGCVGSVLNWCVCFSWARVLYPAVTVISRAHNFLMLLESDPELARLRADPYTYLAVATAGTLLPSSTSPPGRDSAPCLTALVASSCIAMPSARAESASGWRFDTRAAPAEMRTRRIGRNELAAIQVARGGGRQSQRLGIEREGHRRRVLVPGADQQQQLIAALQQQRLRQ